MNSFLDGGAPMETPDLSLSDNIDPTDDLLPSLQVGPLIYRYTDIQIYKFDIQMIVTSTFVKTR